MEIKRCQETSSLLPAYVENELSQAEQLRISRHLEICGACRREELQTRAAFVALANPLKPTPTRDLRNRVFAQIDQMPPMSARPRVALRLSGSLAGVAFAAVVGAQMFTRMTTLPAPLISTAQPHSVLPHTSKIVPQTAPNAPTLNAIKDESVDTQKDPVDVFSTERVKPSSSRNAVISGSHMPTSMLDVVDSQGNTARKIISGLRSSATQKQYDDGEMSALAPSHKEHVPGAPGVRWVSPSEIQTIQVKGKSLVIRTQTGYDEHGQVALIRVHGDSENTDKADSRADINRTEPDKQ